MALQKILALRRRIKDTQNLLQRLREELVFEETSCVHDWGEPKRVMDCLGGYISEGDAAWTMGVDRRDSVYIESRTTIKWVRTCKKCGKSQETEIQIPLEQ